MLFVPTNDPILDYFYLVSAKPELFVPSAQLPLVLDEGQLRAFAAEQERPMGVVYNNLPYYVVVADLCRGERGLFPYSRIIYPNPTNGAVAIPRMGERFGLLRQFRHVPRMECLEFPRGFADAGAGSEENIRRELEEEMGAYVSELTFLGKVRADTGLAAGCADVYLAQVDSAKARVGHEGIRELVWLTREELRLKIAGGEITDGFTLSSLTLLWAAEG